MPCRPGFSMSTATSPRTPNLVIWITVILPADIVETPTDDSATVADAVRQRLLDAGPQAKLRVRQASERPRVLIMVSSSITACRLLYRWRNGLLHVDIPAVVSNHPDVAETAERYGIPFHHLPVTGDTKAEQESAIMSIVDERNVDLVVPRYMQILSDDLCQRLDGRAINIHHSLLPGFKGAKPYHQAHARGVGVVGATAHFVTAQLDEGPIIEQDVARVNHSHTAADIVELGQDTERLVLARAVRMWAETGCSSSGTAPSFSAAASMSSRKPSTVWAMKFSDISWLTGARRCSRASHQKRSLIFGCVSKATVGLHRPVSSCDAASAQGISLSLRAHHIRARCHIAKRPPSS